jgi:hypothetical protein
MVLIGSLGILLSFYSFWMAGKLKTGWLTTFTTVCCGFLFATALLWVGYGVQRNEIIYNRSVELPVWTIGKGAD